jgi:ribonucleotide reductase beta subunit family protein with ferritin-like domain
MVSERITWAQIQALRQEQSRKQEEQAKAWCAEVTEQLVNQQSKFLLEFDENERRIFGLID